MSTFQKLQLLWHQEVGQLFYAIAAADKVVHEKEYAALRKLVSTEWEEIEEATDQFGVNAVYQMEIVFDWFDYEGLEAEDCFDSFKVYYNDHPTLFTPEKKKLIWKTAQAIADAFAGKNKSELILLSRLHLLFKS